MLQDTGERLIPGNMKPSNLMLLEHYARYSFALAYMSGRTLDIACGSGYGSHLTAKLRKNWLQEIVAVDIDANTLDYARKNYQHPLITYVQGDALDTQLPQRLGTFDAVVSFETIEHVENDILFVQQLKKMLRPGGRLIVSTPFGDGRGKPCGSAFHVHQLTMQEFQSLFASFTKVDFYCQNGVAIEKCNEKNTFPRVEGRYSIGIAVATL